MMNRTNVGLLVGLSIASLLTTAAGAVWNILPSLRWFVAGDEPDAAQRRAALGMLRREVLLLAANWVVGGAVFLLGSSDTGKGSLALVAFAVLFGAVSGFSTSLLFSQRLSRPIVAAAHTDFSDRSAAPGVVPRLVLMWVMNSALPSVSIALLVVCHAYGWFIPTTASVILPVLVMTTVSTALGLRALILVSRSISDPINDVVAAMADVGRGHLQHTVDVYEQSEIGRLQHGFNRMVGGLVERDRLRDLFGRHVGPEVVRLAVEADPSSSGEDCDVAILFIDLAGSTRLAARQPPHHVAEVLNAFFGIVVAAVDARHGSINKFQGDAALAVFGAPIPLDRAAAAALETARALTTELRTLPIVDFGIGVSAGRVFAGNIGAENRYEYTVIGDPVNEAARLSDVAKSTAGRVGAAGAAIDRADDVERRYWTLHGDAVLRGRPEATHIYVPREEEGNA